MNSGMIELAEYVIQIFAQTKITINIAFAQQIDIGKCRFGP